MTFPSHSSKLASPGDRREYFTNKLNVWGMTGKIGPFRQAATAYRNARDWAKEQREEAIRQANQRARERQAAMFAADSSSERISSRASETTLGEDSRLTQESWKLLTKPPTQLLTFRSLMLRCLSSR
jgi:hypothetical protein